MDKINLFFENLVSQFQILLQNLETKLPFSSSEFLLIIGILISFIAASIALQKNRKNLKQALIEEQDQDSPGEAISNLLQDPKSILPHFQELKQRLIYALVYFVFATIFAMLITNPVLESLAEPAGGLSALQAIAVTEPFTIYFKVSLVLGLIIAAPYLIAQIWIFIAVGLKSTERNAFYLLFPFAVFLFISGVVFAYKVMLPVAVPFLLNFMNIQAVPTLEDYIAFVLRVLIWIGIAFEMPLIFFALAKIGIVNSQMLSKNWRYAILGIVVLAAVITPTPDPINMLIVTAPLIILYIISIILTKFARKNSEA
jgi:sec-independent protein translocase protein TatC